MNPVLVPADFSLVNQLMVYDDSRVTVKTLHSLITHPSVQNTS